ncbi:MAG: SAF domain-containing protein [Actinomycetes bacterium]
MRPSRAGSLPSQLVRVRAGRTRTRWLFTSLVALVALGWTVSTVNSARNDIEKWGERRSIPVANVDLEPGHVIRADEITLASRPVAMLPDDVADSPIGRTITRSVARGEPIIERRLAGGAATGPASLLDQNRVGFAIPVDSTTPVLHVGDSIALFAPSESVSTSSRGQGPAMRVTREAVVLALAEKSVMVGVSSSEASAVAQALLASSVIIGLTN